MNFGTNPQHDFPKIRGGVKGRFELFRKFIRFGMGMHPKYDLKLCKVQIVDSNKTRLHQSRLTKMIRSPTLATFSTTLSASLVTMSKSIYVVHHQRGIIQDGCCSEVVVKHEKLSSFHE